MCSILLETADFGKRLSIHSDWSMLLTTAVLCSSLLGYKTKVGEVMNTSYEKERLKKTTVMYVVVMVLIVILMLIIVQDRQIKTVAIILTLLIGCAAIIVQWLLIGKHSEPEEVTPFVVKEKETEATVQVSTQTGAICEVGGQYHCSIHPNRTVVMQVGKRFPPCRGDHKGHSATWILER